MPLLYVYKIFILDYDDNKVMLSDALDRFFSTLRNICREDRLDAVSCLKLLEVIEMRAMRWKTNENVTNYFTTKLFQLEVFYLLSMYFKCFDRSTYNLTKIILLLMFLLDIFYF